MKIPFVLTLLAERRNFSLIPLNVHSSVAKDAINDLEFSLGIPTEGMKYITTDKPEQLITLH